MNKGYHIGIDLGGTNIRAGIVHDDRIDKILSQRINAKGAEDEVVQELFAVIDQLINGEVQSIGIGVPGLVDEKDGVVFDVVNIPAWKEVALKAIMEDRYGLPVLVNNDANCFALGEFYFGKGKGSHSMIGLTIGTGLGSGIIINNKLYSGRNGGAGEFGMIAYLDQCYEYYASGQFFQNVYNVDGETVFQRAETGNKQSVLMYEEMGMHLGNAIKMMLYALDVEVIVLGGSVRNAFKYFEKTMWQSIETFAYINAKKNLRIEISELKNSGILGASALYKNWHKNDEMQN